MPQYRLKWLRLARVGARFTQKAPIGRLATESRTWRQMLGVKQLLFSLPALHTPTGLLSISGLIAGQKLFAFFLVFSKPTRWFVYLSFYVCVFRSNAPFRSQLAASRVGKPASFWKRGSWEGRAHPVQRGDRSGCWWWAKKTKNPYY